MRIVRNGAKIGGAKVLRRYLSGLVDIGERRRSKTRKIFFDGHGMRRRTLAVTYMILGEYERLPAHLSFQMCGRGA